MYGSFGEAQERFRGGKKKDTQKQKENREDRSRRDRRRHRHEDA